MGRAPQILALVFSGALVCGFGPACRSRNAVDSNGRHGAGLSSFLVDEPRAVGAILSRRLRGHLRWARHLFTVEEAFTGSRLLQVTHVPLEDPPGGVVLVRTNRGQVLALDGRRGGLREGPLWAYQVPGTEAGPFHAQAGWVAIPWARGVDIVDVATGTLHHRQSRVAADRGQVLMRSVHVRASTHQLRVDPLGEGLAAHTSTGEPLIRLLGVPAQDPLWLLAALEQGVLLRLQPDLRGDLRRATRWSVDQRQAHQVEPVLARLGTLDLLASLGELGRLEVRDARTGALFWEAQTALEQARELTSCGPFLCVAETERTRIYALRRGVLVTDVPGWAIPLAWTGNALLAEAAHVLHVFRFRVGEDDSFDLEERDAVPLPGSIGTLLFAPMSNASSLVFATVLGEVGILDLKI